MKLIHFNENEIPWLNNKIVLFSKKIKFIEKLKQMLKRLK